MKNFLKWVKQFAAGSVFTLAVAIPIIAAASDLLIDTEGTPTIIADGGKNLYIGSSDESTPGDVVILLDNVESHRFQASTGNLVGASGGDYTVTGGDFILNTTDRALGADAADQTVKVCGGVAGAGCDAEAIGAWAVFEGVDFGGSAVGGGIQIEGAAGDGTSDVKIATNHDDADVLIAGGTSQATHLTIEGDTGDGIFADGDVKLTAGDVIFSTTDRGVGSDADTKTVNVCGGTAGAACNAEAVGAYITLEGQDNGATDQGGALTLATGAGTDGSADFVINVNHDDSDFTILQRTTLAASLTIESDTKLATFAGAITSTAGDVKITSGDLIMDAGEIKIPAAAELGLTGESGANTACNTTCTDGCVAGLDTGSSVFVACSDATADTCLCASDPS